jgi:hypothetical protein
MSEDGKLHGPLTAEQLATQLGYTADALIAVEIAKQDAMWGIANERTDSSKGQLLQAALAQLDATHAREITGDIHAFESTPYTYPSDWSGFRDYGSTIANLVVTAAFIRQEIKRRLGNGESTLRKSRNYETHPYTGDQPAVRA